MSLAEALKTSTELNDGTPQWGDLHTDLMHHAKLEAISFRSFRNIFATLASLSLMRKKTDEEEEKKHLD